MSKIGESQSYYSERFYGCFERQITLDRDVDEAAVKATFRNGILTITVPKSPPAGQRVAPPS